MFSTSAPKKKKKVEPIKVFRFCILGSPEVGKTSLCTLYNSNHMFSVYKHTQRPKFFCRDFSRRMISLLKEDPDERVTQNDNDDEDTGSRKKKKKRKKRKKKGEGKILDRYGVQMIDVPGEVHKDVAPNTEEVKILTNRKPDNHATSANDDTSETASLLVNRFSDKQNRLHDCVLPHAFIIVFDANEVRSFDKAITIARFIRDEPNNPFLTSNPIFFLANKTDAANSKEDIDRSWAHYQRQVKHLIETVKTDSKAITRINKASIKLNHVQNEEGHAGTHWTIEEYIDNCVQRLNEIKKYSTGDNELTKKRRQKQAETGDDGDGGSSGGGTGSKAVDDAFCAFCGCVVQ